MYCCWPRIVQTTWEFELPNPGLLWDHCICIFRRLSGLFRSSAIVISLSMFLFYYVLYYRYDVYIMCWKHIQWNLNWCGESHCSDKLVPLPGPVVSLSWTAEFTLFLSQIIWVVMAMLVVGLIPAGCVKHWLYRRAYLITFRILARSLSAIITVHNKQNMVGGVCVANHTSPIDIVMLSTENCFSLVSLHHIDGLLV